MQGAIALRITPNIRHLSTSGFRSFSSFETMRMSYSVWGFGVKLD